MTCKLPALRETATRQFTGVNLFIVLFGAYSLMPYLMDRYYGEPAIHSALSLTRTEDQSFVSEMITVSRPNSGYKTSAAVDELGRILCSENRAFTWIESRSIDWEISEFIGCPEPKQPYKICSFFAVTSNSGIKKSFGVKNGFCTDMIYPSNVGKQYAFNDHRI